MLYWLAQQLDFPGVLNLIRYLSFRAGASIVTALVIGLLIGPRFIGWLRVRHDLSPWAGQAIRVRLRYATDNGGLGYGAYVDNAAIPCEIVKGRPLTEREFRDTFAYGDSSACRATAASGCRSAKQRIASGSKACESAGRQASCKRPCA